MQVLFIYSDPLHKLLTCADRMKALQIKIKGTDKKYQVETGLKPGRFGASRAHCLRFNQLIHALASYYYFLSKAVENIK